MNLTVETTRPDDTLHLGLRQDWIDGTGENDVRFDLTCGAGVGTPYLILSVDRPDGSTVREVIDIRDLVRPWVDAILKEKNSES